MITEKLKINSKKLKSGRFQVNFSVGSNSEGYYGYLLAEPRTKLCEVIEKIKRHLQAVKNSERYFQRNLFSLGRRKSTTGRILIFKKNVS
jgi:hypothetical protein